MQPRQLVCVVDSKCWAAAHLSEVLGSPSPGFAGACQMAAKCSSLRTRDLPLLRCAPEAKDKRAVGSGALPYMCALGLAHSCVPALTRTT